jgi:hypothetical protein
MRKPDRPKAGQIFRCAIYTRKSSDEGLEAATPRKVTMRSLATQPAASTRPTVLARSLTTPPAAATRPPALMRSLAIQPAAKRKAQIEARLERRARVALNKDEDQIILEGWRRNKRRLWMTEPRRSEFTRLIFDICLRRLARLETAQPFRLRNRQGHRFSSLGSARQGRQNHKI